MRRLSANVAAFLILALILILEGWVFGPTLWQLVTYKPGECSGYTVVYSDKWGNSRWDCAGNRHPDDEVAIRAHNPEEAIVRPPPRTSRYPGDRQTRYPPDGWRQ